MLKNMVMMLVCVCMIVACGGGSTTTSDDDTTADTTAPTVGTVIDTGSSTDIVANAAATLSGTTSAATFTITFSEAMDATTITTDNITLSCNETAQTITLAVSGTEDEAWTATPSADLPGYSSCELTIGTGVKDAAGNALAEAAAYTFSTQCATNDNFVVDTLGFTDDNDTEGNCWTYRPSTNGTGRPSYFAVVDGTLQYNTGSESPVGFGSQQGHAIYKTFDASSFTATLEVQNSGETYNNVCGLAAMTFEDNLAYVFRITTPTRCVLLRWSGIGSFQESVNEHDCAEIPSGDNHLYFQLVYDGSTVVGKYRYGATGDFTEIGNQSLSLGSSYKVGVWCVSETANFTQILDSFTIDATATGPGTQY